MIKINRSFDEGDDVLVGGVDAAARCVSSVATTVTTPDDQVTVIPNKNVWVNVVTDITVCATRRVDMVFGVSCEDSVFDAEREIEETVKSTPLVLADPEPVVRVHEPAPGSVNFICRPWTRTSDYRTPCWDLANRVKDPFSEAGVSMPCPRPDAHIESRAVL